MDSEEKGGIEEKVLIDHRQNDIPGLTHVNVSRRGILAAGVLLLLGGGESVRRYVNSSIDYEPGSLILDQASEIEQVERFECARYARLSQKKHFDIDYVGANAWDIAEKNRSVWKADEDEVVRAELAKYGLTPDTFYTKESLEKNSEIVQHMYQVITLRLKKHLEEGMLIGTFVSPSGNNRKDRPYTHILAYKGEKEGKHFVHHQFGKEVFAGTLENDTLNFTKEHFANLPKYAAGVLMPREVIAPK